jgi:tRNA threonylcarbamoyladenosine biosynthesis protein TsaE
MPRTGINQSRDLFITRKSTSEQETFEVAKVFARTLRGGEVILLSGDLGSGKTVFAKGIAAGLGIQKILQSPTFVLMKTYKVDSNLSNVRTFVHIDIYRLNDAQELVDIGILDYLGRSDTVVAIEWPEKAEQLLQGVKNSRRVQFKHGKQENERIVSLPHGRPLRAK